MTKLSLSDVKNKINEYALKINAPDNLLPAYVRTPITEYATRPIVEVDDLGFAYYTISERGEERSRKATYILTDFLYWVFDSVTFSMACNFEVKNRIEDKDSRRIMFAKQEELMGILHSSWEDKKRKEHDFILVDHPYDDLSGLRANYFRKLREQGYPEEEISKIAYEKYPKS